MGKKDIYIERGYLPKKSCTSVNMKRPVLAREARRILSSVQKTQSFWLCTNENLRSLSSLISSLQKVNDDVFRYHVNREKNDFERWIREIVKDKELAREIARVKTKETLIRKISERVSELKAVLKRHIAVVRAAARRRIAKGRRGKRVSGRKAPAKRKQKRSGRRR